MGTTIFRSLVAGLSLTLSFSTITLAADYVQRVIILSEGHYDYQNNIQTVPVTIAVYDPSAKTYSVFDTIEGARFATQARVEGDFIYAAADNLLVKYDRYTLQRLATQTVEGIRGIATWNDKLIVTRGEYLVNFSSNLQVYNQSDLSFDYELDTVSGPKYASQNVEVIGDKAYFVINNGFAWPDYKGLIGVIDLSTQQYVEFDLGPDAINPDNLMLDGDNLITLNNKDYTGGSITVFNLNNNQWNTTMLPITTGCSSSAFYANHVWYQPDGSQKVHQFNPSSGLVVDSIDFGKSFYGMGVDPVNSLLYATTTDYVSTGAAFIYDANRSLVDSFAVGVSAGSIAFDVRKTTGITEAGQPARIVSYPNPAMDELKIEWNDFKAAKLEVFDLSGKQITSQSVSGTQTTLNIRSFPKGVYYLIVTGENGMKESVKFSKQ